MPNIQGLTELAPIIVLFAIAAAVLAGFSEFIGSTAHALAAFHSTFICVGLMTSVAAWIFWQLPPDESVCERKDVAVVE